MSVGQLRKLINDPKLMGMPKEAENLIILLFATQTNRTLYLHRGPFDGTLANVPDACELRTMDLPDHAVWNAAVKRAQRIFAYAGSELLNANNVQKLTSELKLKASEARRPCHTYLERLQERILQLGIDADTANRLQTAKATRSLLDQLQAAEESDVVDVLASAEVTTTEATMAECVIKAAELEGNLDTAGWDIFQAIRQLTDKRKPQADQILSEVRQALESDEQAVSLAPVLKEAQAKAVRLLTKKVVSQTSTDPEPPPVTLPPQTKQKTVVDQGELQGVTLESASGKLSELKENLRPGQSARINLSWIIEEGGADL